MCHKVQVQKTLCVNCEYLTLVFGAQKNRLIELFFYVPTTYVLIEKLENHHLIALSSGGLSRVCCVSCWAFILTLGLYKYYTLKILNVILPHC